MPFSQVPSLQLLALAQDGLVRPQVIEDVLSFIARLRVADIRLAPFNSAFARVPIDDEFFWENRTDYPGISGSTTFASRASDSCHPR